MPDRTRKEKEPRKQDETSAGQEARPDTGPSRTHESGYGGRAGEPRTSSDEREMERDRLTDGGTGNEARETRKG